MYFGTTTKSGCDEPVDLLPLVGRSKTEVRELARQLDVPERIVEKPPTAGPWGGPTDETDLGAPYGTIDAILSRFVDDGLSVPEVEAGLDVDGELVADLAAVHDGTEHKRSRPPPPSNRESS